MNRYDIGDNYDVYILREENVDGGSPISFEEGVSMSFSNFVQNCNEVAEYINGFYSLTDDYDNAFGNVFKVDFNTDSEEEDRVWVSSVWFVLIATADKVDGYELQEAMQAESSNFFPIM
jgi:hypothetical protein